MPVRNLPPQFQRGGIPRLRARFADECVGTAGQLSERRPQFLQCVHNIVDGSTFFWELSCKPAISSPKMKVGALPTPA